MIPQKPTEAQRRAAEFIGRAFLVRALAEVRVWGDPDKRTWGLSKDTRDLKGKKKRWMAARHNRRGRWSCRA